MGFHHYAQEVVRIECYGCSATLEVGVPPLRDMLSQITQQQILSGWKRNLDF